MAIAALSAAAPVLGWTIVGDAIDNGIKASDPERLTLDVVAYVGVGLAAWLLGTTTWLMLAGIGQRMVLELRRDLFDHLTGLSLRYFSQQKAGWIIARLTSDVDALSDVLNQGLTTLVVNSLTLLAAIGGLFLLDWRLGVVALIVLPPGVIVTRWFQTTSHVAFDDVRTRIAAVTAQLAESVAGMAVVQAFSRERTFQREFGDLNEANRVSNVYAQKLSSVFFPAIEFLGVDRDGGRPVRGRAADRRRVAADRHVDRGGRHAPARLPAAAGALRALRPGAVRERRDGPRSRTCSTRSTTSPTGPAHPNGAHRRPLELDDVVFAYGDEPVIHGISIDVPAGGCIALVGESGGGKSTTAKLIARFYDPLEGAVRVDGIDLRDVQLRSYRRQLGVVLQDPFLFSGTIADNIRFGGPRRPTRRSRAAAEAIGVDRITARSTAGLEHVVREGGAGLSAGERQLISIARALLADPRILILDEATSNIDRPSEILIEQAFDTAAARPHVDHHRAPARDGSTRRRDSRRSRGGGSRSAAPRRSCSPRTGRSADSPRRSRGRHCATWRRNRARRSRLWSGGGRPARAGVHVPVSRVTRPSRSHASDPRGRRRGRRPRR